MRIQVVSDLHLAHEGARRLPGADAWRIPPTTADVVVVAGDWCHSWQPQAAAAIDGVSVPVVTVLGNHDWYDLDLVRDRHRWRDGLAALPQTVHLLDPGVVDLGGVRFIGCTWWAGLDWTETGLDGGRPGHDDLVAQVNRFINDFRWIHHGGIPRFTARDMIAIHRRETEFLRAQIAAGLAAGRTVVVVTHFSPSRRGIPRRYAGHPVNPYFHNDAEDLTAGVALWIHGHTHVSVDYVIPHTGCRVLCNPRGYQDGAENREDFRADLVVEV